MSDLRIELLGPRHDRAAFSCGVDALDRYLRTQARQELRKHISTPFVLLLTDTRVVGFYTLSAAAIDLPELPPEIARRLPRYPRIPATLLGRLAVDQRHRGRGYGRYLLADALHRCLHSEIASYAVIVDAKDDDARRFYAREGFLPFPDQPSRLFLPMAVIAGLFRQD
ncbi:MAG: GNAT family N-acetyltransferase [Xanthomonadaceae bacterium]|nr:GNAT family N-acetyltransferase [Xanthomonadaceae bacterium]